MISLVARLSCGHDLTLREVREVPLVVHCPECEVGVTIERYVDNQPVRINGKSW